MRREEREGREEGGGGEKCIHLITDTNVSNATDSVPFFLLCDDTEHLPPTLTPRRRSSPSRLLARGAAD